ncbi:MAG: LysR family transcriptional regulator [Romboutsia sp.]
MRISSLKYFYEVAELKSISKVSNNLRISQPA